MNPLKLAAMAALFVFAAASTQAQSTFGTVLGTIKEPSGAVVPNAKVQIVNKGTGVEKATLTDQTGNYEFVNMDVGSYEVSVQAVGFQTIQFSAFALSSRETKRVDASLNLATQSQTVNVESAVDAVVQTDVSNSSESKGSLELTNLPVAITTRANGSTSAFSTLTAQPGVQTDSSGNIMVAGAMPSQLSITIDGISSVGPGSMGALGELFPSFNAIEEIKISETLNPAEFGGVADVTTVSKSGTNQLHGGLFENVQNTDLNAADTFSHEVTPVKMNDFGLYVGGPVVIPHVYNGHDKTFFFESFEVLRLPKNFTQVESVPTLAMRNGDLSGYGDPLTGYPGNIIPASQLSPYTQKLLDLFYPLPNYGPAGAVSNNYLASFSIPINSAQDDIRVDQVLTKNQTLYARYTYKNRRVLDYARDSSGNPGSVLLGETSRPEIYNATTIAHDWIINPRLVNEIRGGYTKIHRNTTFDVTTQQAASELGLTNLPGPLPGGDDVPTVSIAGFIGIHNPSAYLIKKEGTTQILDTVTYTRDKHTFKFGGDVRKLSSLHTQVFSDYQLGSYQFNGGSDAVTSLLGTGAGVPFASFLLGYPDQTTIATVINPDTYAYSYHYAAFAQDDWKISPNLTLNFGLRWEFHPSFHDHNQNLANFDPNYVSTVDGQTVNGAVIIPSTKTYAILNPGFVESIAPTPILTAAQAGIPNNLRYPNYTDFAPRAGFAWRVFGNNKTVLRGGYGRFIEALLASGAIDGWAVESSDVGTFANSTGANGLPVYSLPYSFPSNIAQPGTQFFDLASNLHYKDPYVQEWNLTIEQDLGKGVGLRLAYDGNHGSNLGVVENIDQLHPNTQGYNALYTNAPFPLMSDILSQQSIAISNYNAATVSLHKRSSNFQFELSYVFTRNLSNAAGAATSSANSYTNEMGGLLSDPYNPGLDYGNVSYTRRNRVLATFLYELPFGSGKMFFNNTNGLVDRVINGWELSGVLLFQTGPFLTVTTDSDPSGTGYNLYNYNGGRADTVAGVSPNASRSIQQWINPGAFTDPGDNIGRFGSASQGDVVGPGTQAVSLSLLKQIRIRESLRIQFGAQVANAFNHPNYAPPGNLTVGVPAFGQITSLQSAEGAGPRSMQLTGRITF